MTSQQWSGYAVSNRSSGIGHSVVPIDFSSFSQGLQHRMVYRSWRPARLCLLALLIMTTLFAGLPRESQAKDTLIWILRDFPPLNIFTGPLQGQGAIDKLMPELIARMPEYDHQIMHVNRARGTQILQDPEIFACDPTLLWTAERAKTILFSIPTYATPGNGLITERRDHALFAPFVTEDGHIDLAAVLTSNTVKVGVVAERSYGPIIDNVLHQATQDNLVLHYGNAAVADGTTGAFSSADQLLAGSALSRPTARRPAR
jgi:uncharacterized protein (TIGR02285 family)